MSSLASPAIRIDIQRMHRSALMTAYGTAGHDAHVPELGIDIYTFDGKRIGTVTALRRRHFKVGRRWAPGYWLNNDLIHDRTAGRVTLYVPHESLSRFRVGRTWPCTPQEEMERWLLHPPTADGDGTRGSRVRLPWRRGAA